MKFLKKEIVLTITIILTLTLVLPGTSVFATELYDDDSQTGESTEEILETLEELEPGKDYVEGEFIVGFKDNVNTENAAEKIEKNSEVSETEVIGDLDSAVVTVSDNENLADVMTEVSENKNVEYVEPNYYVYVVDDSTQTGTYEEQLTADAESQGTNDPKSQYYLDTINITGLWNLVTDKAKYVSKYAIVDTGCAINHEDLQTIDKDLSVDVTETDNNGNYLKLVDDDTPDPDGHGTSVASVSSSEANNGKGIAGVTSCYTNDKVDTFVVGIANRSNSMTIAAFARGIDYAIEKGANVINTSIGTYKANETIEKAVKKAYDAGVIVIGAGGNKDWYGTYEQDTPNYPSDYPECISITALNQLGRSCAYYEGTKPQTGTGYSYGEYKDLAAPGVSINCAMKTSKTSYGARTGTSFAGPMVASVVALLFTLNPDLTFEQVYKILTETATDVNNGADVDWTYEGFDPYTGYGLINATVAGCEVGGHTFENYVLNEDETYTATCKYCGESKIFLATPVLKSVENSEKGITVQWNKVTKASQYRVFYKTEKGSWKIAGDTASTSFEVTGLNSGVTYVFTVRCLSEDGTSYVSQYDKTGLSLCYLEETKLSLNNISSGLKLSWSAVTGAEGYYVYRENADGSYTKIKKIKNNTVTEYTDTTAVNGTTYTYAVRAYKSQAKAAYVPKTCLRLAESKITSLVNVKTASIKVSWTANKEAAGYQICVKNGSSKRYITIKNNTTLTKKITNLKMNTTCKVYVRSYKKAAGKTYHSNWNLAKIAIEK